ncbi:MAG: DUF3365 domain-containing protein [Myxococcales bacterium]|nr:DUF3365 domain-containing protein [Myxococcales bacterium]
MKTTIPNLSYVFGRTLALSAVAATLTAFGCTKDSQAKAASPATDPQPGLPPERVADMLHSVMEADRTVYTRNVVNRLVKEQQVQIVNPDTKEQEAFKASEQWKTEHGKLPLPAQMFRMGAERVTDANVGFTYALLSKWPINKQNNPKTDVETKGLEAVAANGGDKPFYGKEELGGKKYLTAVYADVAVASACIDCHNDHKDSPKHDFELDDVMGGVVIRIPL